VSLNHTFLISNFGQVMRFFSPIDIGGFLCLLAYGILTWVTRTSGDPSLQLFLGLSICVAATTFFLYIFLRQHPEQKISIRQLIIWAIIFRVCGLIGGPFYEDDYYRYLWDAFRFFQDGTPYGLAPEAFFQDSEVPDQFQRILDGINYPELPTIYGPVTQIVFLGGYLLSPGSVIALQVLMILFDLLTIGLLIRLAPLPAVLLYAWSPLVIKEVAFTAHPDIIAICLVVTAFILSYKNKIHIAAICLAFAVGAKIIALLVVPFVLLPTKTHIWGIFLGTLGLIYLPFILQGSTDLYTLLVFTREWEFNAAFFGLLKPWLPNSLARMICGFLLAAGLLSYYLLFRNQRSDSMVRGDWIYGGLFALWPVVNSWYLLWLLPFSVLRPSAWAWTASVVVLLSYITGLNLNNFDMHPFAHPDWVRPVEYGLILIAMGYDLYRYKYRNQPTNDI